MIFTNIIFWLLIANGVFDLFSAADMLTVDYWKFHSHMFTEQQKEPIAFWVLTYGIVRLVAGIKGVKQATLLYLAAITYWLECVFYVRKTQSYPFYPPLELSQLSLSYFFKTATMNLTRMVAEEPRETEYRRKVQEALNVWAEETTKAFEEGKTLEEAERIAEEMVNKLDLSKPDADSDAANTFDSIDCNEAKSTVIKYKKHCSNK